MVAVIALAGCRRAAPPAGSPEERAARPDGVVAAPVVDSHVHLAYWPVGAQLAAAGVTAAVDLAAPLSAIGTDEPLTVVWAGPMITRPGGYPIDAWDPGGFGAGCGDRACVESAIAAAAAKGARVVKLALGDDGLAPDLASAAVTEAHRRGLVVAAHALDDAAALTAADLGCDVLAHTPVEQLSDATVGAWAGRAVISTLAAFGGSADAVDNLRRLREVGAVVLYGTDLGNSRVAGVDPAELKLLAAAGLDGPAIVDAMTTAPARFWKLPAAPTSGPDASYVILTGDPRVDPARYTAPIAVYHDGRRLK